MSPQKKSQQQSSERTRAEKKLPQLFDDPKVARVQLLTNMPKRLAEHINDAAKAIASQKK